MPGKHGFEDFDARMRKLRSAAPPEKGDAPRSERPLGGAGVQVGVELVAGVIGGGLIGYGLDFWLDTWPVLFIGFFFLGAAAGMLNAYRYIRRASELPEDRSERR